MASYGRRCDVMKSHRLQCDVILTSCARWALFDADAGFYTDFCCVFCCLHSVVSHSLKAIEAVQLEATESWAQHIKAEPIPLISLPIGKI